MYGWLSYAGFFLAALTAVPACAQTPINQGVQIGRLFFTPQQRQELDKRRALNIPEVKTVVNAGTVTVNGHISRSSGKTTTWVNGVPQHDAYRPRAPDTVPVAATEAGPAVPVRVGQTLDKANATVSDNLQGGTIRVERGTREGR